MPQKNNPHKLRSHAHERASLQTKKLTEVYSIKEYWML
jgi:hypothetical protein